MAYDNTFGTDSWLHDNFHTKRIPVGGLRTFSLIFPNDDKRQHKPHELALAAIEAANEAFSVGPTTLQQAYMDTAAEPTPVTSLIRHVAISPLFGTYMKGIGYPLFLLNVARHIAGDDFAPFQDLYRSIERRFFNIVVAPFKARTLLNISAKSPTELLEHKRDIDIALGLIAEARKQADDHAQKFLVRAGFSGSEFMMTYIMDQAWQKQMDEWGASCFELASDLMKPGAVMSLVAAADTFKDRMTIYRRRTDTPARIYITKESNGDFTFKFRDKSTYLPVRDYIAAGYLHMAYTVGKGSIVPVVDSDDINSLMLDLTVPVKSESIETVVNASAAHEVVASNVNFRFRTDHVQRYLVREGFSGFSDIASFQIDAPKGINQDLYWLGNVTRASGSTTHETLVILQQPEVFTKAEMKLLGKTYTLSGLAAIEYAEHFAAQVFGALIPYDSDTGHVVVEISDEYSLPTKSIELVNLIRSDDQNSRHYLIKDLTRRVATELLGLTESAVSDDETSLLGVDLLEYYLRVFHLLGFGPVAEKIRSIAPIIDVSARNRTMFTQNADLVLTWTHSGGLQQQMKPLSPVFAEPDLRYRVAMMQIFLQKVTNERVLRAMMHALSIYINFNTTDLDGKKVEDIWEAGLVDSIF